MKETFFLEFTHFCMKIKKNYATLKKKVSLWDGDHCLKPVNKSLKYGETVISDILEEMFNCFCNLVSKLTKISLSN